MEARSISDMDPSKTVGNKFRPKEWGQYSSAPNDVEGTIIWKFGDGMTGRSISDNSMVSVS